MGDYNNNRLSPLGIIIGIILWVLAFISQCGGIHNQRDYDRATPRVYKTNDKKAHIYTKY
jgi:hypothetical protein